MSIIKTMVFCTVATVSLSFVACNQITNGVAESDGTDTLAQQEQSSSLLSSSSSIAECPVVGLLKCIDGSQPISTEREDGCMIQTCPNTQDSIVDPRPIDTTLICPEVNMILPLQCPNGQMEWVEQASGCKMPVCTDPIQSSSSSSTNPNECPLTGIYQCEDGSYPESILREDGCVIQVCNTDSTVQSSSSVTPIDSIHICPNYDMFVQCPNGQIYWTVVDGCEVPTCSDPTQSSSSQTTCPTVMSETEMNCPQFAPYVLTEDQSGCAIAYCDYNIVWDDSLITPAR